MPRLENFRDKAGPKLETWRKQLVEGVQKHLGDPPSSAAGHSQKDDNHDAYWKLGKGWEDLAVAEQKAAAMYAQGAKRSDVLKVMYPFRLDLIIYGDRRDDIVAQDKFCDEMVARHFELLAEEAVALRDTMLSEGEGNGTMV